MIKKIGIKICVAKTSVIVLDNSKCNLEHRTTGESNKKSDRKTTCTWQQQMQLGAQNNKRMKDEKRLNQMHLYLTTANAAWNTEQQTNKKTTSTIDNIKCNLEHIYTNERNKNRG